MGIERKDALMQLLGCIKVVSLINQPLENLQSFFFQPFRMPLHIVTDLPLPDTTKVDIRVKVKVDNLSSKPVSTKLVLDIAGTKVNKGVSLSGNASKIVELGLRLKNPKLWWPNGYGTPNLYDALFDRSPCDDYSQ